MKIVALSLVLALVLLTGCAAEPFAPEPLVTLVAPNPDAMRDEFAKTLPARFDSDDTVIIQAPFRPDIEVLGALHVDRSAGTFELVGLSPLGVTYFDLTGDRNGANIRSAVPPLMAHADILKSIGQDIFRMYFDLLPGPGAKTDIGRKDVWFSAKMSDGTMEYQFASDPPLLLEKSLHGFFGTIWRVRYFEYHSGDSSLYPRGIVMDNERFHYRIIVKNRDRTLD